MEKSARRPRAVLAATLLSVLPACSAPKPPPALSDSGTRHDLQEIADTGTTDAPPADGVDPGTTPRPIAPLSGSHVRLRRPTFRWAGVTGITRYRVELSRSRDFSPVESSFTADGTTGSPEMDLPVGLRFWRAVTVPPSGSGAASVAWEVHVGQAFGDVNGDNYSDIVVGAPGQGATGGPRSGRVFVYHGGAAMDATADLTLAGEMDGDYFGYSVSTAGDLNNDGHADLVVGAPFSNAQVGRVYVYLGGTLMSATPSLTIDGPAMGEQFGWSVAIVGDTDGDGYADLAVGAPAAGMRAGRVYLYRGGATPDALVDAMFSGTGDAQAGFALDGAGDVDGDGLADIIAGAPSAGQALLYLAARPGGTAALTLASTMLNDRLGHAVAGAWDLNGDGYGDLAVGIREAMTTVAAGGAVNVYFGGATPDAVADLQILGDVAQERLGSAVAGLGDVDGDGFADLGAGAPGNTAMGPDIGQAFVFHGGATMDAMADTSLVGQSDHDNFGGAIARVGDTDGDGYSDILVGALYAPYRGRSGPGSAYCYGGGRTVSTTPRFMARGGVDEDHFGTALAGWFPRACWPRG